MGDGIVGHRPDLDNNDILVGYARLPFVDLVHAIAFEIIFHCWHPMSERTSDHRLHSLSHVGMKDFTACVRIT